MSRLNNSSSLVYFVVDPYSAVHTLTIESRWTQVKTMILREGVKIFVL